MAVPEATLERREFVRLLIAAAVSRSAMAQQASHVPELGEAHAPAPVPWTLGVGQLEKIQVPETDPPSVAQFHPTFFTAVQMATLRRLSALLLPPLQGRPGALDAGTPEFLDTFIGESGADIQRLYQQGLDWLESSARKSFSTSFAELTDDQAGQLIRPWLRTWMADHLPTEPHAHFINAIHADIRLSTINSPAWDRALCQKGNPPVEKLYWLPIEPDIFQLRVKQ